VVPAGSPGDEPLIDILRWRRPVYSLAVDSLIAELAELWDGLSLETFLKDQRILWMDRSQGELARAEALLAAKRDELYRSAKAGGWDMASMDERINSQRRAVAVAWSQERPG
jgi:hypothetical protein